MPRQFHHATRGSTGLVGSVLFVGLLVVLAGVVGAAALDTADSTQDPIRPTVLSVSVADETVTLIHEGGAPLDVRSLRLRITVDGDPLAYQPPIPFFSARGFRPGPTGPFNVASDPRWTVGEEASLELAGTNEPALSPGVRVVVRVYDDDTPVAVGRTMAS
ncbi:type IV pilin [Haloferax sp. MBLA0076]|uniref:Type IV pilin n=1 Tax=Haloferax litoreum TaxID=2666140 RepID=A0A6A8GF06_9EURY|nr:MULTISPECIES: type IV pilin [Haloferax]KAB1192609.1 type IV pilin [Haloferax sp. CBA1148]MRX21082.1 type IV pilin [Haloferax litoreum]